MRLILCCSVMAMLLACGAEQRASQSAYFDTKAFFEAEAGRLHAQALKLDKTLVFGERTETQHIDTVNWQEELEPFTTIDMRKPAYAGRFMVDSAATGEDAYTITYTRTDPKTDLAAVEIRFMHGTPRSFRITMQEKNTLYASGKVLQYDTDSAFSIEGQQSVALASGKEYRIAARFIKP